MKIFSRIFRDVSTCAGSSRDTEEHHNLILFRIILLVNIKGALLHFLTEWNMIDLACSKHCAVLGFALRHLWTAVVTRCLGCV